ncbi:unnamed protein product [Cuscuta europaea]|nr:unnamed protein product [Cuscuta europaea]
MSGAQDRSYVRKQTTEKEEFPNLQLRSQDYNKMGSEIHEDPYANLSGSSRNLKPPLKANSSEKRHKRLGDEEREVSDDDHSELPYLTKKVGFQMLKKKSKAAKYLKADKVLSPCYSGGGTTSGLNQTPHHRNPAVNVNAVTPRYSGAHCDHAFSSKAKKFSSPKKNLIPISQTSVVKCSSHKKFMVPCSSRPIIMRDEETCEDDDKKEYDPAAESQDKFQARQHDAKKAKVLRIRKEDKKDEDMSMKGLHFIAGHCGRDIGNNNNNNNNSSSTFSVASGLCDDDHLHHVEVEPALSELSAGRKFVKLSKHMGGSGVDENSCLGADDDHTRLLFGNVEFERKGRYFICCDKEGMLPIPADIRAIVTQKHEFQGGYCHLEVDSIPIPGPPGSFIPSPGRTFSEEVFQGNSSLVTSNSRPQSSEENHHPDHELFLANRRGVSSDDSPVSATSTLSHFTRSSDQPDASGKPWLYSTTIEVENQSSGHHHGVENPTPHLEAINVTLLLPKKGFKYSSSEQQQSCCCGCASSQTLSLSYQEPPLPQLLQQQRRTTPLPPTNLHLCQSKVSADSGLPSPSKPVIRLMGKNVLVDSKDDDDESMTPKANPSPQISFTREAGKPYHQTGDLQGYHRGWSAGSGLMTMGSILDRCGSFGGGGGYGVITEQAGDVCNQMASLSHSHYAGAGSTTKEVIVIKDSSSSSSPNCKDYNNINGMVESRCPGGNSVPPSTYTTHSMNYADLYGGHTHHHPGWAGVAHAASFGVNGQWNHSSESSDAVNGHPLAPPTPSSTRHLGSSLYCTPGFS